MWLNHNVSNRISPDSYSHPVVSSSIRDPRNHIVVSIKPYSFCWWCQDLYGGYIRSLATGGSSELWTARNAKKFHTMTLVRAKSLQSLKFYQHGSPLERMSKDLCQGQFCTGVYCSHIKKCTLNPLYFSCLKQFWILSTVWSPHQSILHPLLHHYHEIRETSCFFPLGAISLMTYLIESRPMSCVSQSICLNYVICMFLSVVSLIWRWVLSHCHSFDFLPGAVGTYGRFNFCIIFLHKSLILGAK